MSVKHTFKYLLNSRTVEETRDLTPARAIRFNCLDCAGGSQSGVRGCEIVMCPLWPLRDGKAHTGRKRNSNSFAKSTGVIEENAKKSA